jgi:hypothetical protein
MPRGGDDPLHPRTWRALPSNASPQEDAAKNGRRFAPALGLELKRGGRSRRRDTRSFGKIFYPFAFIE